MALIYKFLSIANAKQVIESKRLKVSLIHELNDIFDCSPVISPSAALLSG